MDIVGIISPGDMGSAIGKVLGENGMDVITCLEGRSDLTQLRAQTLQQEAGSNLRAAELIDAFLRRVATAPLLQV